MGPSIRRVEDNARREPSEPQPTEIYVAGIRDRTGSRVQASRCGHAAAAAGGNGRRETRRRALVIGLFSEVRRQ